MYRVNKLVVFASGSGSNFQAIIDAIERGDVSAAIRGLITSRHNIGAIEKANRAGIEFRVIAPGHFPDEPAFAAELLKQLKEFDPDLIILAGYMVRIPSAVVRAYPGRIINIHPSLLPKYGGKGFYGLRVHQAVLDAGETVTGCTVHLVDEQYDRGPILAQRTVPVHENDTPGTLAERVLEQEHQLLPITIQKLLTNLNQTN